MLTWWRRFNDNTLNKIDWVCKWVFASVMMGVLFAISLGYAIVILQIAVTVIAVQPLWERFDVHTQDRIQRHKWIGYFLYPLLWAAFWYWPVALLGTLYGLGYVHAVWIFPAFLGAFMAAISVGLLPIRWPPIDRLPIFIVGDKLPIFIVIVVAGVLAGPSLVPVLEADNAGFR